MATASRGGATRGPKLEPHQVILQPLVTEKGTHQFTRHNAYPFQVNPWATKDQIKAAVEELFNVRVEGVPMGLRYYKPTTPGRRQGSVSDFSELTDRKKKPEKSLLEPHKKKGGRNNQGIVCTRFRGGGHKRMYRIIDFKRRKDGVWATVLSIEYDPNRTSRIALLQYEDGVKTYILAPEGLKAGDKVISGEEVEPRPGNSMP